MTTPSLTAVSNALSQMRTKLDELIKNGKDIGSYKDGPLLRNSIQNDAKSLAEISKKVKDDIFKLKQSGLPQVDQYENQFISLKEEMQKHLPPIVEKLRSALNEDTPSPQEDSLHSPLVDQQQIDSESEQIDVLEGQVRDILQTMREVHQIFTQTLEELNKQRNIILSIESNTEEAKKEMKNGNFELEKAKEHQKGSTGCLCWLLLFFIIIVGGIALYIWIEHSNKPTNQSISIPKSIKLPLKKIK